MTKERLTDFMAKHDQTAVHFLDMDYEFIPYKRGYHCHRFVKNKDFELQKIWSLSSIDICYPFLDPLKNLTPRELTNILFAPDLENDFYRGPAVSHWPFLREVYVNYTLYRVIGPDAQAIVLTLQGDSDDQIHSPQCLIDRDRFWEVTSKHRQYLLASLNRSLTLQGLTLSSGTDEAGRMPSSVAICGSLDGAAWHTIETLAMEPWRPKETRTLAVSSHRPFPQYKLSFDVRDSSKVLRVYGLNLTFVEAEINRMVSVAIEAEEH